MRINYIKIKNNIDKGIKLLSDDELNNMDVMELINKLDECESRVVALKGSVFEGATDDKYIKHNNWVGGLIDINNNNRRNLAKQLPRLLNYNMDKKYNYEWVMQNINNVLGSEYVVDYKNNIKKEYKKCLTEIKIIKDKLKQYE